MNNIIMPYRITTSAEDDVLVCVIFKEENIMVYIEYYTDGEIGLIAENIKDKKTLVNIDIREDQIIDKIKEILYPKEA